ncbi:hypothetical protein DUI87_29548 [Hirundo rustica rustica]|uniref:ribonuclease H n=1 Tax=Hirundo rustica rustica TaxID=333673 RepID=A0A3M0J510_HIRRU|nr:hypothetical protein DUI87_29548 [Hirundo rustica rustica]
MDLGCKSLKKSPWTPRYPWSSGFDDFRKRGDRSFQRGDGFFNSQGFVRVEVSPSPRFWFRFRRDGRKTLRCPKDLDAAVVIPADLKQLFSCLLDSTEFKLWVAAWRQQLREALPSLLRDLETAVDNNGNPLTLEHLMGEGRWADPSDQTSDIPIKALQIAREHAVSAFFGMVPDSLVIPYYKIMQGAKESFTKFVERLTRAIEVQVTEVAWYVASLLSPVRAAVGQAIIYHYMDDVLVCTPNDDMLSHVLGLTVDALVAAGFELQEEKVQQMPPWKYLGLEIGKRTIVPQKLAIKTKGERN